jgi:hypothetical protein
MPSIEERLKAAELRIVHIEEQVGSLETDVKRFKKKSAKA